MKFRKSDLRDGDIVTYRNGKKRVVNKGELMNKNYEHVYSLRNYTEELKDKDKYIEYDIVKVERPRYETVFERKEEILDEAEKRYLRSVIRPFRKQVKTISKQKYYYQTEYYIQISLEDTAGFLPNFKTNTMYKNMKTNKEYTLEELGI